MYVSVPFTSGSSLQQVMQRLKGARCIVVSVPFTSGSSLQLQLFTDEVSESTRFSSLYIGILAATHFLSAPCLNATSFSSLYIGILAATGTPGIRTRSCRSFRSLYIGILAATLPRPGALYPAKGFSSLYIGILAATAKFFHRAVGRVGGFSSLYIGILAATQCKACTMQEPQVSVPFTSGSSLQPCTATTYPKRTSVSVPFTSGSSLQLRVFMCPGSG